MSKRNFIVDRDRHTPLRRSPRLLHKINNPPEPHDARTPRNLKKDSKEQCRSDDGLRRSARLNSRVAASTPYNPKKDSKEQCRSDDGLRRSARLNRGVAELQNLRRNAVDSPRFCNPCVSSKGGGKAEVDLNSSEEVMVNRDRRTRKSLLSSVVESKVRQNLFEESEATRLIIVSGLKASGKAERGERNERAVDQTSKEIRLPRKRKRGDFGNESCKIQGWTTEQEIALQRAYYAAKPTPHFWKKVAKLVPGKSAQDCFDKVHSDHITPPQLPPRSRAKKMNLSPLAHFSLSASNLLKPTGLKIRRSSWKKKKSYLPQKNVRQLLQKKYCIEQDCEADLFSVLEPNINSSTQVNEQNDLLSTPNHLQEKQKFLQKFCESSSGCKKPLSRFSGSCGMTLVSPPVLKQVKDKALHEKYIDQLHCREAKRKVASAHRERLTSGTENKRGLTMDVIKAAKIALVTDAQNAINQFQHLHANTMSDSSDTDGNGVDCDDDEDETEI